MCRDASGEVVSRRKGWESWGCPQHSVQEADLSPGEAEELGVPKDGETEGIRRKCCDLTGAQWPSEAEWTCGPLVHFMQLGTEHPVCPSSG